MFNRYAVSVLALFMTFGILMNNSANAGSGGGDNDIANINETDTAGNQLVSFFDLRDRDSFVQVTNADPNNVNANLSRTIHVQIFDASNQCTENNFNDTLTPDDTHVYDMRNLVRNSDGLPLDSQLPDNAYGIVVISAVVNPNNNNPGDAEGEDQLRAETLIGNFRVIDDAGYEYRTNSVDLEDFPEAGDDDFISFNFSERGATTLSDVIGVNLDVQNDSDENVRLSNASDTSQSFDVFVVDNKEIENSCRSIGFACVEPDDPIYFSVLDSLDVNVARLDYGINEIIPGSRSEELLCPNNFTPEGFVRLRPSDQFNDCEDCDDFVGFVGLNDGNGRGSMDSFWKGNPEADNDEGPPSVGLIGAPCTHSRCDMQ